MRKAKGTVVDMFSRKDMQDHGQDTSKNDMVTADKGLFVGTVPPEYAKELRQRMESLNGRGGQLDAMVKQWQEEFNKHVKEMYLVIKDMGVSAANFDPSTQDIMISKDGKVWVVDLVPETNSVDNSGMVH